MVSQARLPPLPSIRDLLKLYGVRALRNLSQNFLLDKKKIENIVNVAFDLSISEVCEIGPGPGGITRAIINQAPKSLTVIEKDTRFEPILESLAEASSCKMNIIYDDIKGYDMSKMFSASLKREWEDSQLPNIYLIGNLPFNVSTHLILLWLKDISMRKSAWSYGRVRMILTFQEEVALRMVAPILSKYRCRLSVMCQNWCKVKHKFTIPGKAFLPKPDVNVGVVYFEPLIRPVINLDFYLIEKVLRTTFNGRQKFIINNARNLFPKEQRNDLTEELFARADLNTTMRPFQITNEEFGRLCHAYKLICDKNPKLFNYEYRANRNTRETTWMKDEDEDTDEENIKVRSETLT